ncbi:hypothetical protein [Olivibacter oleidegradans]|uniref:Uncharacterized protein n=1 Tax=Olivibacter oleidegradans TaxID=760123 RepID=A0ABV6HDN3_9SPHI
MIKRRLQKYGEVLGNTITHPKVSKDYQDYTMATPRKELSTNSENRQTREPAERYSLKLNTLYVQCLRSSF